MDDLTMVLAPEVVATTAEFISVESAKLGLDLNFSKCELMSMQGVEALRGITAAEEIHRVPGCVKNLGIPIGPDLWYILEEISGWHRERDGDCVRMVQRTSRPGVISYVHRHQAKLHASLCTPLRIVRRGADKQSHLNYEKINRILGMHNSPAAETDTWWLQGTLPPAMGGFGIIEP
jgi:hypothetical protein